jgi:uncharacterized membrane protein
LGIIYLSFFAGFKIYNIIPLELTFALLAVIVAAAALLAFLQDSEAMAFFAAVIGFAAPILLSTGTNNYIALFSFYTVLNLCVLAAAFRKYWRYLNGVSFLCTYAVGFAWAREYYVPENFIHILIFATIFFIIFTLVNFLSAARTGNRKVENVFAVATPFAYMATLLFITRHFQYGQAIAAFSIGIFYYLLYLTINRAKVEVYRPLAILYLPFAIVFLNFSVPLALSGEWTTAIWALEGAMLAVIGGYQKNRFFRFFGLLLILGASYYEPGINHFGTVFLNSDFVCRILTAASMLIAAGVFRLQEGWEKKYLSYIILFIGLCLWYSRLLFEISANSSYLHSNLFYLAAFSVSGLLIAWGGKKLRWFLPQILGFSPVIAALLISLGDGFLKVRVTDFYWAGWLIFVLVQAALLYIYRDKEINKRISLTHAASLYFAAALVGESLNYGFFTLLNPSVGESLDYGLVPLFSLDNVPYILTHSIFVFIVLSAVTTALIRFERRLASPYPEKVLSVWRLWGGGFITAITLCCLFWLGGASEQVTDGMKTLPVFNTADAASLIIVVMMILYLSRLFKNDLPVKLRGTLKWIRGLAVFFWANALIGRAVFFFSDDSYYSVSWLMSSSAYQLAIAVFWALTGFMFVAYGVKKFSKTYWSIGAALLVIDAIKLFLIDLSRVDTIQRILSFLGVGVIFILIGYFFPLPSAKKEEKTP